MGWVRYDDVGEVFELSAVYDDALKKDDTFIDYAVMVANRILEDLGIPALATWGKWGARIEPDVNPHLTHQQIEQVGENIMRQPSWDGLKISTHVFTYGKDNDKVIDYQADAESRAKETEEASKQFMEVSLNKSKESQK